MDGPQINPGNQGEGVGAGASFRRVHNNRFSTDGPDRLKQGKRLSGVGLEELGRLIPRPRELEHPATRLLDLADDLAISMDIIRARSPRPLVPDLRPKRALIGSFAARAEFVVDPGIPGDVTELAGPLDGGVGGENGIKQRRAAAGGTQDIGH